MMASVPRLKLLDVIMLVSGSMIGSGVFIVTADMSRTLGSAFWVMVCWALSGLITLLAALSYGELSAMMPQAGGQFVYIKRAFGSLVAFVYGWTVFMVIQTGVIAAVAVAFAKYMGVLFPVVGEQHVIISLAGFTFNSADLVALLSICLLTFIHTRGINYGAVIQRIFTFTKIAALLVLVILGFSKLFGDNFLAQNFSNPFQAASYHVQDGFVSMNGLAIVFALGSAIIGALFSSDAWNNVTFLAGEIKNPARNLPIGLTVGVLLVTILYILSNLAYFILLPLKGSPDATGTLEQGVMFATNDRVATAALFPFFGEASAYLMATLIVVSTFGCNNGIILAGSRLFQAMAKDGLFFKIAEKLNGSGVPAVSLWIQCLWACLLCLSGSYGQLLTYATFASLLFYVITISGLFVLRKKEPNTHRPYKAWGYPIIPALYILITLGICLNLLWFSFINAIIGVAIILLGIPIYFLFKKFRF